MMVSVLLRSRASGILDEYPNLAAYVARGEARPAYKRAFAAQLAMAHPGFRGAGSDVRRPVRRLRRQEELFLFCVYYGRTERTRDRWGAFLARYRDEAVARSAAATKILPSC